jgi:copper chaperone
MSSAPATLAIEGMTCSHCVAAVQRALAAVPGVVAVRVALGSAQLDIESVAPAQVVSDAIHAVERAGYDATAAAAGRPALAPTSCCSPPTQHRLARA